MLFGTESASSSVNVDILWQPGHDTTPGQGHHNSQSGIRGMDRITFEFNAYKKTLDLAMLWIVVNHKRPDSHFKELKIDRKYISWKSWYACSNTNLCSLTDVSFCNLNSMSLLLKGKKADDCFSLKPINCHNGYLILMVGIKILIIIMIMEFIFNNYSIIRYDIVRWLE